MKNKFLILFLASVVLFPATSYAAGAAINLSPAAGDYSTDKTFNLIININPNGQTADTARIQLKYPANLLEIKNFAFGPSFTILSEENNFDNSTGVFTYGAGAPEGFEQTTVFGTITFYVKSAGQAQINLDPSSLILADGNNIFDGNAVLASYSLSSPPPPADPIKKTQSQPKSIQVAQTSTMPLTEKTPAPEPAIEPIAPEPEVVPLTASVQNAVVKTSSSVPLLPYYILAGFGIVTVFTLSALAYSRKKNKISKKIL